MNPAASDLAAELGERVELDRGRRPRRPTQIIAPPSSTRRRRGTRRASASGEERQVARDELGRARVRRASPTPPKYGIGIACTSRSRTRARRRTASASSRATTRAGSVTAAATTKTRRYSRIGRRQAPRRLDPGARRTRSAAASSGRRRPARSDPRASRRCSRRSSRHAARRSGRRRGRPSPRPPSMSSASSTVGRGRVAGVLALLTASGPVRSSSVEGAGVVRACVRRRCRGVSPRSQCQRRLLAADHGQRARPERLDQRAGPRGHLGRQRVERRRGADQHRRRHVPAAALGVEEPLAPRRGRTRRRPSRRRCRWGARRACRRGRRRRRPRAPPHAAPGRRVDRARRPWCQAPRRLSRSAGP